MLGDEVMGDGFEGFSREVRRFSNLDLDPLQARILKELMDGNRTTAELVLSIYNLEYRDDEYRTYQSRVRRSIKNLESQGLVSKKKLFGREKPYGITVYGAERIASIIPDMPRPVIIGRWDYALFTVTVAIGIVAWVLVEPLLVNLFSLFLGMTVLRSIYLVRRVT